MVGRGRAGLCPLVLLCQFPTLCPLSAAHRVGTESGVYHNRKGTQMNQYPAAHLPDDFSNSQNPQTFHVINKQLHLDEVFILNNAAILQLNRVADVLATLGYCIPAADRNEQSLFNTLQLTSELLKRITTPTQP